MGHRAEKNRLRHGFASGERPPQPGVHDQRKNHTSPPVYRNVLALTGFAAPKRGRLDKDNGRRIWAPRHLQREKKNSD